MTTVEVTWHGHSTVAIDHGGYRVMTDPLLTARVAHLRRRRPRPAAEAGDVDLVLVSHAHADHLHVRSLRRLRPGAAAVTPAGSAGLLRRAGLGAVAEVSSGDRLERGPAVVETVPAVHRPGRGPHRRIDAAAVGYVVTVGGLRIYFAGDTDLFGAMTDLGDIDLALLPIWGWGSTLGEGHLDPERAAEAFRRIDPARMVPIHWGTYAPEDGRRGPPAWFDRPPRRLAAAAERGGWRDRLSILEPGETLTIRR